MLRSVCQWLWGVKGYLVTLPPCLAACLIPQRPVITHCVQRGEDSECDLELNGTRQSSTSVPATILSGPLPLSHSQVTKTNISMSHFYKPVICDNFEY